MMALLKLGVRLYIAKSCFLKLSKHFPFSLSLQPAEEASGDDEKKAKRVCTEESKSNGGESAGTTTSETTQAVPEQ